MLIDDEYLQQITMDVCQSMLGLELIPINLTTEAASHKVASVEIRGGRHSVVEVFAHEQLMVAIAAAMFSSDGSSLSEAEIRDAFGESANMIGGNVKGGYGEDANLSLPTVGEAPDWISRLPNSCLRTTFECCGFPLSIVLRDLIPNDENSQSESHVVEAC